MADLLNCPNCDLPNQPDTRFCYCGYDLCMGVLAPDHMVRMSFRQIWWSFDGRIDRTTLWFVGGMVQIMVIWVWWSFFLAFLSIEAGNTPSPWLGRIILWVVAGVVMIIWPNAAFMVKRMHDRNRSGWWCLLYFVPIANIWLAIQFLLPGTTGRNRYGPQP